VVVDGGVDVVEQLARCGALVAADQPLGRPVHPGQPVQPQADQHPVDGGGRPPHRHRDPGGAELAGAAQPGDLGLDRVGDPARVAVGGAWPVDQARLTRLLVAGHQR
jgi:hypothetical protein